ncbi:unnamed protein product [Prorocentrum cordatum]|uniref:Uncharacterized protein n=1 Tax=Prorocentrum cordatum TaxID=2364126 RepID=A0ABN9Q7G1_9DINO|nr:unnamed protein product [Polarella glacialis]
MKLGGDEQSRPPRLAVLGSREWWMGSHVRLCSEVGRGLARRFQCLELVTNGMEAVQAVVATAFLREAVVLGRAGRGALSVRYITPSNVPGAQAPILPEGVAEDAVVRTVAGATHAEARMALAEAADACLLISGGPGSASVAERALSAGRPVLCVPLTGGAAAGGFWLPADLRSAPAWLQRHPAGPALWAALSGAEATARKGDAAASAAVEALVLVPSLAGSPVLSASAKL